MKRITLILSLLLIPFYMMAQGGDAEKINQWIETYNDLVEQKDWSSIIAQQGRTKSELPEWDVVYYYVGFASYNLKDYEDAIMNFSIFLDMNKEGDGEKQDMIKSSLMSRADANLQLNQYSSSIKDYNDYLKLSPNDVSAILGKANVYLAANDLENYIEEISAIINLEPSNQNYISNRAGAYANLKRWDLAIEDYTKLIELDAKNVDYYSNRAFANYSKDSEESLRAAIQDYNKVIELGVETAQIYNSLAVLNNKIKDYAESVKAFDMLLELRGGNDINILYQRGTAKFLNKDYEASIEDFDKVIEEKPDHINALKRRATAKTRIGDKEGAQEDAIKIKELEG